MEAEKMRIKKGIVGVVAKCSVRHWRPKPVEKRKMPAERKRDHNIIHRSWLKLVLDAGHQVPATSESDYKY